MQYMFLLYFPAGAPPFTEEQRIETIRHHYAVIDDATAAGIFRGASPLTPARTALTVRSQGGQFTSTDGPFAETKEVLGGYYMIDCKDMAEAEHWGRRLAGVGRAAVEVRAVGAVPARV